MKTVARTRIGELLVKENLVSEADVSAAAEEQKKHGGKIGEILIARGRINGKQLYSALATQNEVLYANLLERPCDKSLLSLVERENYISRGAIPWMKQGDDFIIAVDSMEEETVKWVKERFHNSKLAMTSKFDIDHAVHSNFKAENTDDACNLLWRNSPRKSAKEIFNLKLSRPLARIAPFVLFAIIFAAVFTKPVFIILNIFYFATMLFKSTVFAIGALVKRMPPPEPQWQDSELPVYTLLVPLFKEKHETIRQLINSIRALDYPKTKLDIKLIIEESDRQTKENILREKCERIFEIIEVPYSQPQTKPKALNYALKFARGEYATIYDAEDRPDPGQLKEALAYLKSEEKLFACAQARLNYYNRDENLLTRMFALEYSSWFDFMLRGLERLGIPIPLGGTSNHFPIGKLNELLGWDPYNVTEDADLGVRIATAGYRTALLDSSTLEEAPVSLGNWIRQRSRWIKGHIQTYIVQVRDLEGLYRQLGARGALGFLFFIGAPAIVFLTMPFVLLAAIYMIASAETMPQWFLDIAYINLLASIVTNVIFAVVVSVRSGWWNMLPYSLAFPFYWILHSIASFRAVWQLIVNPHYWDKTEHGVSKTLSF